MRTDPVGTNTALTMFEGGSPNEMIGARSLPAGSARREVPGTALGAPDVFTGAGDCDETTPSVTKMARIKTPSPRTIMAGRMEKPPGVGGRRGASGGSATRVWASGSVMATSSLRPPRPTEMVERPVPRAETPAGATGQGPAHEVLGRLDGGEDLGAQGQFGADGGR